VYSIYRFFQGSKPYNKKPVSSRWLRNRSFR